MLKYVIIGAVAMAVIAYISGYRSGAAHGRISQLEATVKAEKERKNVDTTVRNLDDYALCIRAGGVQSDCEQLRRMEP